MKIVIDARISGTSTGRYVDKLVEYLAIIGTKHDIIVLTKKHRLEYLKNIAPKFNIIESNFKEFSFGEQIGFAKQLYALKADLVHFTMVQQPLFYFRPVVTSMLDLTTIRYRNPSKNIIIFRIKWLVYILVNWIAAKRSKHIITISNYIKKELVKAFRVKESKLTTTHCSADFLSAKPEPIKELQGKKFIMYLGRPQPHKNLERLIDAFILLQKKYPELKLVLVGKTDVLFLQHKKSVEQKGIGDSVVFTDFVNDGQQRWLYENCQAYVFPSLSEGFGLPGLEAMTHGAPVVSSNATCLPEIYGDAAHYFNPKSIKEMAEKIDDVLTSKTLRNQLIKKGYSQVKKFSWRRMAEQTLAVYNQVLDKNDSSKS